jgi:hypothetical protein
MQPMVDTDGWMSLCMMADRFTPNRISSLGDPTDMWSNFVEKKKKKKDMWRNWCTVKTFKSSTTL